MVYMKVGKPVWAKVFSLKAPEFEASVFRAEKYCIVIFKVVSQFKAFTD